MRDGTPVGQVRASMFLPAGYVKLEGATVNRSNYPRLVALADTYSLWTDDTTANPGLFGEGDGTTTMVLPNWTGRMAQFAATAGSAVAAGLPNIVGSIQTWASLTASGSATPSYTSEGTGALKKGATSNNGSRGANGSGLTNYNPIDLDASLSNSIYSASTTVQPPAINTFAIMRY